MVSYFSYYISKFRKLTRIPAVRNSSIHKTSKICSGSLIVETALGKYTYVGHDSSIVNTNIGSFCSIADGVKIGGASHPISWVSSSPVFTEGKNILNKNFSTHAFTPVVKTEIGSDVWIGNNALIKSGVKIGHGAIIGMGAVVTKSIPDYEIWAGNPAKLIKKRFNDDLIKSLLIIKWWECQDSEIERFSVRFTDVCDYINSCDDKD